MCIAGYCLNVSFKIMSFEMRLERVHTCRVILADPHVVVRRAIGALQFERLEGDGQGVSGRSLDVPLTVEVVVVGRGEVGTRDGTVRGED